MLTQARGDFDQNLQLLARPLSELGRAAPDLLGALKLSFTPPFDLDSVPKLIRGDYINASLTIDLTLSALDNGVLTYTASSLFSEANIARLFTEMPRTFASSQPGPM